LSRGRARLNTLNAPLDLSSPCRLDAIVSLAIEASKQCGGDLSTVNYRQLHCGGENVVSYFAHGLMLSLWAILVQTLLPVFKDELYVE
jgi:hypothetical protein